MTKLSDRRVIQQTMLLLAASYFVSYLTRINFGAVIYEMVRSTGYSKEVLSTAVTGAFLTYGAGQIFSGWLGDRMQPKTLMLLGLLLTSAMNLLIPFCPTSRTITAIWCVNGFAQAFLWPPLVRLMAALLEEDDYRRCIVWVHWAANLATILLYLLSPALIALSSWKAMFLFSSVSGLLMSVLWVHHCPQVESHTASTQASVRPSTILLMPLMLAVMATCILTGALRDGVTTWMPTFIGETYHLGTGIATLSGVALPLFAIASQQLTSLCYKKLQFQPLTTAAAITAISVASTALLLFTTGRSVVFSVLGAALLTGSMHGINMAVIAFLPSHFQNSGCVSTISGVLNACIYIGSAISTYGFAAMSEASGWGTTILLWLVLSVCIAILCILCIPAWKKQFVK